MKTFGEATTTLIVLAICSARKGNTIPIGISSTESPLSGECYGPGSSQVQLLWNLERLALNSTGHRCFEPIDEEAAFSLLHKKSFNFSYKYLETHFCPSWGVSKICLRDHLQKKCNQMEKKEVESSVILDVLILFSELVCEPRKYHVERLILKNIAEAGLWGCISNPIFQNATSTCSKQLLKENNGTVPPFTEFLIRNFACLTPHLELCADSPLLFELWAQTEQVITQASNSFWKGLYSSQGLIPIIFGN